jgi:YidC/Oxa1 family membrane protein insertase
MDRRTVWALLLMMVIAIAPAMFIKRKPAPAATARPHADTTAHGGASAPARATPGDTARRAESTAGAPADSTPADSTSASVPAGPTRTVRVTSPLYTYGVSTTGGRLVEARLLRYRSMAADDSGGIAQILPAESRLLGLTLVAGHDSVPLENVRFTPSTDSLAVTGPASLRLTGTRGNLHVELTYTFVPDDYRIRVQGRVTGVGPNGAAMLVGMGPTLANTEANLTENHRALAVVTRQNDAERTDLASLTPGERKTISGPLAWVAF